MTILDEGDGRGYNEIYPMRKTHRSLGRFSNQFQPPLVCRGKKALLFLIPLAVFAWSADSRKSLALVLGQEPNDSAKQAPSRPGKPGETSSTPTTSNLVSGLEESDLALVQSAVNAVHAPDARVLAEALGTDLASTNEDFADSPSDALEQLGDLDGDGVPEYVLKRIRIASGDAPNATTEIDLKSWELFLLAWNGAGWRVSLLKQDFEPFEMTVISSLFAGSHQIALVVFAGPTVVPYPSIYQLKDHVVSLVWDGRSDDSDYQGYARGKVEFRVPESGGAPLMIISGRADPGLMHFPMGSKRGFDVQARYVWGGKSYAPNKTEYSANEDHTLYQFIAALHLHDFHSAYALIDPPKFLKTDQPSLEIFRKQIEGLWPEFLDDQIFEASDADSMATNPFEFVLALEDKLYVYTPSFGAGPKYFLTGLERREESGAEH